MALIKCPECENSISDKSEVCINCGYPVKAELEKKRKAAAESAKEAYDKKRLAWLDRIEQARKMSPAEGLKECIAIGDEGYALGYATAARFYLNAKKWDCAYDMCMKSLELNPNEIGTLCNLGDIYCNKASGHFDVEKAIEVYIKANCEISYNNLGSLYNPCFKNDGIDICYKDVDKAIDAYQKAIEYAGGAYYTLWNIALLYAEYKDSYLFATIYAFFAKKKGSIPAKNAYESYKNRLCQTSGAIWVSNIENLLSPKANEINSMIARVNAEIKDLNIEEEKRKVHCPYCNSTNIKRISTVGKALSLSFWGFASSKMGNQWHCNSCSSDF